MSTLTDLLVTQHREIADIFRQIKQVGVNSVEGRRLLVTLRQRMQEHLILEDTELYPQLAKLAASNEDTRRVVEFFARDATLHESVEKFFRKHLRSVEPDPFELARDFGALYGLTARRIRNEETALYDMFNNVPLERMAKRA